jgi:hypothetical protein
MIAGVAALVLVASAVATAIGAQRQKRSLAAQMDRLSQAARVEGAATVSTHPADELPAPVARYLSLVLPKPKLIEEVRLRQAGTLRTDLNSARWMSFDADHVVVPPATGFVWDARIRVAPLLHVRVRDALIDGKGSSQVSLLSAFTVSSDGGTLEMNSGSLHRYLAEAVWYPTALTPRPWLKWSKIDATRALATLTNHGATVSLEFRFADTGEVTGIYTPGRWGRFSDGFKQVAWEGHFRNYRHWDGVLVPTEGDVGWYVNDEWHAVWKGTITGFEIRTER